MTIQSDVTQVLNRIKKLQEWKVVVTVPEDFQFYGVVPYDMNISDGVATVKVVALSLDEAMIKAMRYFNGPQEENPS